MADRADRTPPDPWTAAIHLSRSDQHPVGTGVVVDLTRVLTCAHVVRSEQRWRDEVWVAFPKAGVAWTERRRVARYGTDGLERGVDLVELELAEPVPAPVIPARLRCVPPAELRSLDWWTFGFPNRGDAGSDAHGTVGPELGWGKVRLETDPRCRLEPGFSGGAVWSPAYEAVVGLVVAAAPGAPHRGSGHALTIHRAEQELPELKLAGLAQWTAEAADDSALAAWGWALRTDPEHGRHWSPRSRGVAVEAEPGYRFRGRTAALTELVRWLDQSEPHGRVLVVTGSPGVGKSAVLGRVVTTADPELRTLLPPDDHAARASEGSVACAVHVKGKTAHEVACEIAKAASVALPAAAEDLVPALRHRLADHPRRFNLVVDALDEAAAPAQARQLVHTVLLPLASVDAARVVVGTRRADDEGDLLGVFNGRSHVIDLDDPVYFAEPDLAAYATTTLRQAGSERPDNPYADPAVAAPVAQRIAALAGRNFLVAGLISGTHGRHDAEAIEPDKVSFTPTVDAALDAYLAELAPAGAASSRLALTVLAYAEPPGLPLPLWRAGVAALGGEATEQQLAAFASSAAANFLVETNTGPAVRAYRLFHQALGEALLRGREATGSRADDEGRLVDAWLDRRHPTGWSTAYDYLLKRLPAHAARAGRIDDLLADDRYLLHADVARLLQVVDGASTDLGRTRAQLLRRTPLAVDAGPLERAAMFSVTERLDGLDSFFTATAGAPYRARWARTPPRHERASLEGHTNGVLAVCPVPDNGHALLASSGQDGTVRLWDPTTGQMRQTLDGHTDWVRAICPIWAGDRHLLATASDDHTIRLWDPATGTVERILDRHPGWVTAVCSVTVGGRPLLATAGYDPMIRLWDPDTGALMCALENQASWVTALCAVPIGDRQLLATAGYDSTICLWDPASGRARRALDGQTRLVTGLCTLAVGDRTLLAATNDDGGVSLWDPLTGDRGQVLHGHTDWVRGVCELPVGHGRLLASAGDDGTVRLWDPATGAPARVIDGPGPVVGLCGVPDFGTTLLASTARDGMVRVWDPITGQRQWHLAGHTAAVTSVCTVSVAERQLLASASDDHTILLWEFEAKRTQRIATGDLPATAVCVVPGPAGDRLASASDAVRLWDPATAQLERVLHHLQRVTAVGSLPVDGRHLLASADEDGVVRLWDPVTGHLEQELRCHHAAATAVCAVPVEGRQLLASASDDHTIQLWDPESGVRVQALHGHTAPVTGLCVVATGEHHLLASASADRTVRLWDPATGAPRMSIPVYHRALACWYGAGTLAIGLDTGILALGLDAGRLWT